MSWKFSMGLIEVETNKFKVFGTQSGHLVHTISCIMVTSRIFIVYSHVCSWRIQIHQGEFIICWTRYYWCDSCFIWLCCYVDQFILDWLVSGRGTDRFTVLNRSNRLKGKMWRRQVCFIAEYVWVFLYLSTFSLRSSVCPSNKFTSNRLLIYLPVH